MKYFLLLIFYSCLLITARAEEIFHAGPILKIEVERDGIKLPVYKVNHLKKHDKFSAQVDPNSIEGTKWLMVIAQINPTGSKIDKKVFDLSVGSITPEIEIMDDEFLPVVILAPQLRNLFGLYTSLNESSNLIVEALTADPQKFVDLKNIEQLNQAIVAISSGLDNLLEGQNSQKSVEIVKYLAQKFGLNEVDPNCFRENYINTQCVATDIVTNKNMIVPSSSDLGSVVGRGNALNLTSLLTQNLHLFSVASDFLTDKFRDQYNFSPSFARHLLKSTSVQFFSINRFQNGSVKTAYIYVPGWSDISSPKIQVSRDLPICISKHALDVSLDGKSPPVDYWRDWSLRLTDQKGNVVTLTDIAFNFFRSKVNLNINPDDYSNLEFPVKGEINYFYGFDNFKIDNLVLMQPMTPNNVSISGLDTLMSNEKGQIVFLDQDKLNCFESARVQQGNIRMPLRKDSGKSAQFSFDLKSFKPGSADLVIEQANTDLLVIPLTIQEKRSKIWSISHSELEQDLIANGEDLDRIKEITLGVSACLPSGVQDEPDGTKSLMFKCNGNISNNSKLPNEVVISYLDNNPKSERYNLTKRQAKPKYKLANTNANPILVFLSKNAVAWGLKQEDAIISDDSGINLTFVSTDDYKLQNGTYSIEMKFEDDPISSQKPIVFPLIGDKKTNELKTRKAITFNGYELPSIINNVLFRIKHNESGLSSDWSELKKSIVQIPVIEKTICQSVDKPLMLKGRGLNQIEWSSKTDNILNPINKTYISKLIKPCEGGQCLSIDIDNNVQTLFFKLNWIDDRLFGFSLNNAMKECVGN